MTKIALLIGVSEYSKGLTPLPAAIKDIEAMRDVLADPNIGGFEASNITLLKNPERQLVEESIYSLFDGRKKSDLLLLFFSGHGITDDSGRLYLATNQTRKNISGELVVPTAVSANFVHERMGCSLSNHQIVILDSCFSGAFAEGLPAKAAGTQVRIREQLGGEGRAILTSSTSTQYSFEQEGQDLSLYTRFLIEGMKTGDADLDSDDVISIDELHEYARQKVQEVKPGLKPEIYSIREGFKIRLAKVHIADPKQRYRKEVSRYGKRGSITIVNRGILQTFRTKLNISDEEAQQIENEVLAPFREEFQQRLTRYENIFTDVLKREKSSISALTRQELTNLQQHLELRNEDTVPIEAKITNQIKSYRQSLIAYEEALKAALLEESPLNEDRISEFSEMKDRLHIDEPDASSIEANVRAEVEEYHKNLAAYRKAFTEAVYQAYPIDVSTRAQLKKQQQQLKLTDLEATAIEAQATTLFESYQQKKQKYRQALLEATAGKQYPVESVRKQLQQTKETIGLNRIDAQKIEDRVYKKVEAHQNKLKQYEQSFSKVVNQNYPLDSKA
ncbi:MAG: caspase family protein, partial [Cyanobacteria bacterium J06634_6]